MRLYLAPKSSLELIRFLRVANGNDGIEGAAVRKRSLSDAINTVKAVKELDITAQLWLEHIEKPIHAFVAERAKGTSTKHLITHVFSQQIPNGTFLDLGHGVCICTPQFTFLQLASQLESLELLALGMELCGTYSRWSPHVESGGLAAARDRENARSCTYELPPVISAKRLTAFVNRMGGQRGAIGARRVIRWVLDGSASPMETATYLLLCLPRRLGGYGLPKPVLNPVLKISGPDGVKKRYPDLFWLGANIDVEYNSDEAHSGEWSRYRDSKREIELTVANVRVLPLTRPQLMDAKEFDGFAHGLRRMLGIRSRPMDPDWPYRRDELRRFFLPG